MKHLIGSAKTPSVLLITYMHVKFLHLIPYLFHHETARQPLLHTTNLLGYRCESLLQLFQALQLHALLQLQLLFRFKAMNSWLFITFSFSYSQKPFQYAVIFPAFPTGIARTSGAFCNWSQISNAAVLPFNSIRIY